MGFWLFAGIEVTYIIFFILIVVFASIAMSNAKEAQKNTENEKDRENYKQANYYLGWVLGLGYTIIVLGIIALILAFFTGGAEAAAGESLVAGGAESVGLEGLLAEAGQFKNALSKVDFTKLQDTLKFTSHYRGKIVGLTEKYDKLYADLKGKSNGLFYYSKIFGMSGVIGWIEKIILWGTAAILFAISLLAAIAAGYIGRTEEKGGYDYAISAALIGLFPLSIMIIWGISNAIYKHNKGKAIQEDELELREAVGNKSSSTKTRSPNKPDSTIKSPPKPNTVMVPQPSPIMINNQNSPAKPPRTYSPKPSQSQQLASTAKSAVKHADKAQQLVSNLQKSVDPNSTQGKWLSNASDVLTSVKGQKDNVDLISSWVS